MREARIIESNVGRHKQAGPGASSPRSRVGPVQAASVGNHKGPADADGLGAVLLNDAQLGSEGRVHGAGAEVEAVVQGPRVQELNERRTGLLVVATWSVHRGGHGESEAAGATATRVGTLVRFDWGVADEAAVGTSEGGQFR
jgi:hypothetical protein